MRTGVCGKCLGRVLSDGRYCVICEPSERELGVKMAHGAMCEGCD